jgi:hypothetical protein
MEIHKARGEEQHGIKMLMEEELSRVIVILERIYLEYLRQYGHNYGSMKMKPWLMGNCPFLANQKIFSRLIKL